jgi:hypothetical protein
MRGSVPRPNAAVRRKCGERAGGFTGSFRRLAILFDPAMHKRVLVPARRVPLQPNTHAKHPGWAERNVKMRFARPDAGQRTLAFGGGLRVMWLLRDEPLTSPFRLLRRAMPIRSAPP